MVFRTKFELDEKIFFTKDGCVINGTIRGVKIKKGYEKMGRLFPSLVLQEKIIYTIEAEKRDTLNFKIGTAYIELEEKYIFSYEDAFVKYFNSKRWEQ